MIGGLAVTARVASTTAGYRATVDVDFVSADDTPRTLVEVLTARHHVEEPIVIAGIKVDVIPTYEVSDEDPAGIDDGPRLFVAGQRRVTKHASDLLDVYRLVDRYRPPGQLVPELQRAPGDIATVIAAIVRAEYLTNPVKAASIASTQAPRSRRTMSPRPWPPSSKTSKPTGQQVPGRSVNAPDRGRVDP